MDEPPFLLDGAVVLDYARIDWRTPKAGSSVVVNGVTLDSRNVAQLAVVQALVDDRLFLLHCNDRWETLVAAEASSRGQARDAGSSAYALEPGQWMPFREHSADEKREMETTRAFLREIAAGSGFDET
jgi:hypothetical protein